jgi:hypothetical protein
LVADAARAFYFRPNGAADASAGCSLGATLYAVHVPGGGREQAAIEQGDDAGACPHDVVSDATHVFWVASDGATIRAMSTAGL